MGDVNVDVRAIHDPERCPFKHGDGTGLPSVHQFLSDWHEQALNGESKGDFTLYICYPHFRELMEWQAELDKKSGWSMNVS